MEPWMQFLLGLAPLIAVFWVIYEGRHKISTVEADRRRDELKDAVARVEKAQNEERAQCREDMMRLNDRLEKYEARAHNAESEKHKLGTQVAELKGKLYVMEKVMPQFEILMGKPGGLRKTDPPGDHDGPNT